MIVPMRKVFIVARSRDRETLLDAVRDLGMVHLVPVDPARAAAEESVRRQVEAVDQALQTLSGIAPRQTVPALSALEAADEVAHIQRRAAEGRNRLVTLYHQLEQIEIWGNTRLEHIEEVRRSGIEVRFFAVPPKAVDSIRAECVQVVGSLPNRQAVVAVVDREGTAELPDEAALLPLPPRDAPSIRDEAKKLDESLHRDVERLHELAGLAPALRAELVRLEQQVDDSAALRGAASDDALFGLQGWIPAEGASALDRRLAERSIPVVVRLVEPSDDEHPPTLVRPPKWAKPIESLFDMLGTVPGYREFDVSIPFLIALPLFTAMLISDGGYGALLLAVPLLAHRRVSNMVGAGFAHLLMIVGAVSLIWGAATGTFFGFTPYKPLIPIDLSEQSRTFMMSLSFTIGAIHLSLAQCWQAVRCYPDLRFVNKLGWAAFVWGMYGVVRMFVLGEPMNWATPWPYLLMVGAAGAVLFAAPSRNPVKMIGLGLAAFPLSMLSAFSDVISYVRLMAVGLASSVLAVSFNDMALGMEFWPLTAMILLFGHGLNLGLALIAMFAHGVRLNMLEFSNNLGMQWIGYPYQPFVQRVTQEHKP